MTPDQLGELVRTLGIAAPLVGILIYFVREATSERREITDRFLRTMETTVTQSAQAQTLVAEKMEALAASVRDGAARSSDEHDRLVDAIGKLTDRTPWVLKQP